MTKPSRICIILILLFPSSILTQENDNPFGIVEGMWFPDLTCDLNPGWERLIFDWSAHQPNNPDEFVGFLNIDDRWLQAANNCNREVIAVVKNTPAWATQGLPGAGVPHGLDLPVNNPENIWANFMRQMGAYYASRGVNRFIIWNEPDIKADTYGFEFEGDLEDYFMLVKVAAMAVKQGNPAASIHLAGTTFWHDVNSGERLYTDRLLERIHADPDAPEHNFYFDALSLHIYFRTDTVYDIVTTYRELLEKHGFDDKAIWITETNASPNLDPQWPVERPQFQITLEQQAAFLVQSTALGIAAGADRIGVYKLYDQQLPSGAESFGLIYPADASPRPAFYTWQSVIRNFQGIIHADLARNERFSVVKLLKKNQQQFLVMWSRGPSPIHIEVKGTLDKAYLLDQYGNEQLIHATAGVFTIFLPPAHCEEKEGCVVGGNVYILVQPEGDTHIMEITTAGRYSLQFD